MSVKLEAPFYKQSWDPKQWAELGFLSGEDAKYWQKSSCGILCLKMALEGLDSKAKILTVVEHINKGVALGAYTDEHGWSHAGLVKIAKDLGFKAEAKERITTKELRMYLDKECMVVISIKFDFNNAKTMKEKILFWKKYGGHMALVVGYEDGQKEGFLVHHTSKRPEYNGANIFIPTQRFTDGFTGRGVVICK